jgi:hypothetical protein
VRTLLWHLGAVVGGLYFLRWLARSTFLPDPACRWCKGTGKNWWSTRERSGKCWFCRGRKPQMTFGARLVRRQFRGKRWGGR